MKNRIIRVAVITIILSTLYFMFFVEDVVDPSKKQPNSELKFDDKISETDTLLNTNGYLIIGKNTEVKLISISDTSNYVGFQIVEAYKNDAIIAKQADLDNFEIYKKFSVQSFFTSNKVAVYNGKLSDPDFSTNEEAQLFKTRITESCKEGINFAGYYTLVYWGCGTACQYGVIVNRKTGEIIDGYQSSLGSEFKKDSNSIIFNSDIVEGDSEYVPLYQFKKYEFKKWENNLFVD